MKEDRQDLTTGSIWGKMLFFSIPLVLTNFLQVLFNMADIAVIGQFAGSLSLGAVGSTTTLVTLFTGFLIGMGGGTNVLVARFFGAKDKESTIKTIHTALLVSMAAGMIVLIFGLLFSKGILELLNTKEELLDGAVLYIRIYFLGMPAMALYNFGNAVCSAFGDTKKPLYYLGAAGIVNIVLNLFFVIVCKMDVAGVAAASIISQYLSAFLILRALVKVGGDYALRLSKLRFDKRMAGYLIQIGLPAGFQGVLFALSNVIIQASINGFGETVISGNTAASNIEGFIYVACNAFCQANMAFTSQNYGAGKLERLKPIALCSAACSASVAVIGGMLCWVFGPQLLHIYSNSDTVVAAGMARIAIMFPLYILCGLMDVIVGSIRGIGYSITPMIVTLLGACAFRVVWIATIFRVPRFHTPETIYWSYPISWALTFLTHLVCLVIMMRRLYRREGVVSKHHHLTHRHTA